MPTISVNRKDFDKLLGRHVTDKELEAWLPLVKGEIKEVDAASGEIRFELQDSNRPDLWCVEGIARQIRVKLNGRPDSYPYLRTAKRRLDQILVEQGLERVRPFIGGCKVRGYKVAEEGLAQLIQTQEKLADIFGRKRRMVSIGLYRLPSIKFPVTYVLADPDRTRFRPLGYGEPMSLREILEIHPKGQEYGGLLSGHDQVPLLRDAKGDVLSFPPIINSRDIGEVQVGDADLFIEVTGTDLRMVMLAVNILAANLHDRGASIEPVEVVYPSKTAYGRTVRMPQAFSKPCAIKLSDVSTALGDALSPKDIRASLASYGYTVTGSGSRLLVSLPPYRNDLMHPVDVVEDVAISRGYNAFGPIMPATFTVGGLSRIEQLSDKVRELMLGFGFQEIVSNILGARVDLIHRMRLSNGHPEARCVEIENVMSQSYECLRQWVLPSLLRVETASSRSFYPHFLFELGEVVVLDPQTETGTRTEVRLGALLAHANANFSETHSFLDLLCFYLGWAYALTPTDHPSFLEGRVGRVEREGNAVGLIGELHPEVLERWQITMPCSAFELVIDLPGKSQS
ncbi:MAG: phenylalanine--tRNA ligase subunit beta [Nitrospirae bacterium]|nr:MAG: phenylalanine--tRNA ligase subunit beta [Nitrospirota bacterium]